MKIAFFFWVSKFRRRNIPKGWEEEMDYQAQRHDYRHGTIVCEEPLRPGGLGMHQSKADDNCQLALVYPAISNGSREACINTGYNKASITCRNYEGTVTGSGAHNSEQNKAGGCAARGVSRKVEQD
jgi:hypothetical protein